MTRKNDSDERQQPLVEPPTEGGDAAKPSVEPAARSDAQHAEEMYRAFLDHLMPRLPIEREVTEEWLWLVWSIGFASGLARGRNVPDNTGHPQG